MSNPSAFVCEGETMRLVRESECGKSTAGGSLSTAREPCIVHIPVKGKESEAAISGLLQMVGQIIELRSQRYRIRTLPMVGSFDRSPPTFQAR